MCIFLCKKLAEEEGAGCRLVCVCVCVCDWSVFCLSYPSVSSQRVHQPSINLEISLQEWGFMLRSRLMPYYEEQIKVQTNCFC